jgi:hypothetical protein
MYLVKAGGEACLALGGKPMLKKPDYSQSSDFACSRIGHPQIGWATSDKSCERHDRYTLVATNPILQFQDSEAST